MTSKEKRDILVKEIIKPLFKKAGYNGSGDTWYSQREDCYVVIHLLNSRWNRNELGFHFWFNINVLSGKEIENIEDVKKWVNSGSMIYEAMFLPNYGFLHEFRDIMGYKIDGYRNNQLIDMDLEELSKKIEDDFRVYILPKLKMINTISDWIQMKEDLYHNLNTKEYHLLSYYSMANRLAIADSNLPFLQKHRQDCNLTADEIKDNMRMLKEVQKYAETVCTNVEEFIIKSLKD